MEVAFPGYFWEIRKGSFLFKLQCKLSLSKKYQLKDRKLTQEIYNYFDGLSSNQEIQRSLMQGNRKKRALSITETYNNAFFKLGKILEMKIMWECWTQWACNNEQRQTYDWREYIHINGFKELWRDAMKCCEFHPRVMADG